MTTTSEEEPIDAVAVLGKIIWDTSRRDEGSISYTGANIIAKSILYAFPDALSNREEQLQKLIRQNSETEQLLQETRRALEDAIAVANMEKKRRVLIEELLEPETRISTEDLVKEIHDTLDRGDWVPVWPEDERELHREHEGTFSERHDAVVELRRDKVSQILNSRFESERHLAWKEGRDSVDEDLEGYDWQLRTRVNPYKALPEL